MSRVIHAPCEGLSLGVEDEEPETYDQDAFLIPITRRTKLSFDGRGSGAAQEVVLASGADCSDWVSAALVVILHDKNAWLTGGGGNTTGEAQVFVRSTALTPDEPDITYAAVETAAVCPVIQASTTAPRFTVSPLAAPFGPMLRVSLLWSQGSAQAAGSQTLSLSVYLAGRRR
jgi:hypothetical protein